MQSPRKSWVSMYQIENRLFPPESERWFVSANGTRPCAPLLPSRPPSSDSSRLLSEATTKRTYDSSGARPRSRGTPSGMPAPELGCQVVPLSVERRWPSSPQASIVPPNSCCDDVPDVAATGRCRRRVDERPGRAVVRCSWAIQQLVPTNTLFAASGRRRCRTPTASALSGIRAGEVTRRLGLVPGFVQVARRRARLDAGQRVDATVVPRRRIDLVVVARIDLDVPSNHRLVPAQVRPVVPAVGPLSTGRRTRSPRK